MNVATATASNCAPMCPVPTPVRATQALRLMMTEDHAKVLCMVYYDWNLWSQPSNTLKTCLVFRIQVTFPTLLLKTFIGLSAWDISVVSQYLGGVQVQHDQCIRRNMHRGPSYSIHWNTKTLGTEFTFKIWGCVTHVRQENSVRAVN